MQLVRSQHTGERRAATYIYLERQGRDWGTLQEYSWDGGSTCTPGMASYTSRNPGRPLSSSLTGRCMSWPSAVSWRVRSPPRSTFSTDSNGWQAFFNVLHPLCIRKCSGTGA
uniref:Uncharacterized protein n=1 Tax=Laticauda laticaudata TaxID=8630 RepID=A0A8C5RZ29_LATLA